jgi:hypothetical protein
MVFFSAGVNDRDLKVRVPSEADTKSVKLQRADLVLAISERDQRELDQAVS